MMASKLKVGKRHAAKSKPPNAVWRATNHTYLHFKSERSFERVFEIKIPRFHWRGAGSNLGPKHIFMARSESPGKCS